MENLFTLPQQNHLYIYNKFKQRQDPSRLVKPFNPLPFYFFGSGSDGNSVYLTRLHTLIDLGFSYKKYTDFNPNFFLDVDYIILTHEHRDHFRFSTFYKILQMYPNVKFILSQRLYNLITNQNPKTNLVANQISGNKQLKLNQLISIYANQLISVTQTTTLTTRHDLSFQLIPHTVSHGDIQNLAIELINPTNHLHVLYSSDIDHLLDSTGFDAINHLGLPNNYTVNSPVPLMDPNYQPQQGNLSFYPLTKPFNLIFLEANYDEQILEKELAKNPFNPHAQGNLRHISEQKAWKYINLSLTSDGLFIPLHASKTYGTLIQQLN